MKTAKMIKFLMVFVGISGCFSVLFGAWFAHGGQSLGELVQSRLTHALQYQFIHTLVLFVTLLWYLVSPSKKLIAAAMCFFLGIICFSGSLYVKTFFDFSSIGKLAPLGGISLAFGWLIISLSGINLLGKKTL